MQRPSEIYNALIQSISFAYSNSKILTVPIWFKFSGRKVFNPWTLQIRENIITCTQNNCSKPLFINTVGHFYRRPHDDSFCLVFQATDDNAFSNILMVENVSLKLSFLFSDLQKLKRWTGTFIILENLP